MLDTIGPEVQICNNDGSPIELKIDERVTITPDLSKVPSSETLPINYSELAQVCLVIRFIRHATVIILIFLSCYVAWFFSLNRASSHHFFKSKSESETELMIFIDRQLYFSSVNCQPS